MLSQKEDLGGLTAPGGSDGKEFTCNAGDMGWILGQKDPLEKEMATHSCNLAWKIPCTEEPGRHSFCVFHPTESPVSIVLLCSLYSLNVS